MGLACQSGIDVWAICDDVCINFPMPYINNYLPASLRRREIFDYLRDILEQYKRGLTFPFGYVVDPVGRNKGIACPYEGCKMQFNLHVSLQAGGTVRCPQCLEDMVFKQGFLG